MTQKLYLDHSYDTVFEANVTHTRPTESGATEIILDRTLFFPESGGQLPDHGTLGGVNVTDVQERDDAVVHVVSGEVPIVAPLRGAILWPRRFDHMQQHTGQHILSRAFIQTDRLDTVSFHMGEDACTIDLDGPAPDGAAIARAEDLSNQIINENRPVDITTMPIEEVDMSELRRKVPEGVTVARIVTVRDFDRIPCCGTHVNSTGELGMVKVLKTEKVRNFHRVHFKVGARAFSDYRDKHAVLQQLSQRLTTAPLDVAAKVDRLMEDSRSAEKVLKGLVQRLAAMEAQRLAATEHAGSPRVIVHRETDPLLARALATEMQKTPGTVAIIAADDGSVVCVSWHGLGIDLATSATAIAKELGGSGGGKGGFAQVRVSADKVDIFLERMNANVRARFS
jgi:alanyl-tRNA synthetase